MASIQERNAVFIPFALSANGAPGPATNAFLKKVFGHAKIASEFSMRHSYAAAASAWSKTWLSTYWRQRIAAAVTAANAVFIRRVLNADAAAACRGLKASKLPRFPRYYFIDPRRARKSMAPSLPARCSH